ncbi:hypothetical protein VTL71DRAFT_834 [Oculimacula yallundae]|uniref:Uncharacterized protein n=1 Tax=Oculimacula yallundae TaxID=86028 RepID=A0ABR4D298_9HELO
MPGPFFCPPMHICISIASFQTRLYRTNCSRISNYGVVDMDTLASAKNSVVRFRGASLDLATLYDYSLEISPTELDRLRAFMDMPTFRAWLRDRLPPITEELLGQFKDIKNGHIIDFLGWPKAVLSRQLPKYADGVTLQYAVMPLLLKHMAGMINQTRVSNNPTAGTEAWIESGGSSTLADTFHEKNTSHKKDYIHENNIPGKAETSVKEDHEAAGGSLQTPVARVARVPRSFMWKEVLIFGLMVALVWVSNPQMGHRDFQTMVSQSGGAFDEGWNRMESAILSLPTRAKAVLDNMKNIEEDMKAGDAQVQDTLSLPTRAEAVLDNMKSIEEDMKAGDTQVQDTLSLPTRAEAVLDNMKNIEEDMKAGDAQVQDREEA